MEALMLAFKTNIVPHPITKNWAEHSATQFSQNLYIYGH